MTAFVSAVTAITVSQAMFLQHSYEPMRDTPNMRFNGLVSTTRTTTTKTTKTKKNAAERKRVVIVGDSLATGVGCTTTTPALARVVAEQLAELLSVEIEWIAVGKKGAALSDISTHVLPELRKRVEQKKAKKETITTSERNDSDGGDNGSSESRNSNSNNSNGIDRDENEMEEEEVGNARRESLRQQQQQQQQQQQKADAVIILCGINDVKTCFLHGKIFFRENFENELEKVIKEIKSVVGSDALVVLPGNPLHIAPLFPNPLREVILQLNDFWDGQKEKVAKKLGKRKALFINSPTLQALRDAVRMNGANTGGSIGEGEFTARDGVHPNDMGYKAWANIIAAEVAKVLKDNEVQ
jgi:lysophospholipase L1-like esterase